MYDAQKDGVRLFNGVFFGLGPFGKYHPEGSRAGSADANSVATDVLDSIKAFDHGFFARFAEMLRSGDRVWVATALEEGKTKLLEVAGIDPIRVASRSSGDPTGLPLPVPDEGPENPDELLITEQIPVPDPGDLELSDPLSLLNTLFAINEIFALNAVVVANVDSVWNFVNFWGFANTSNQRLKFERYVDELADALERR